MAKRPSYQDLRKFYHEKGCAGLVWYAWRNALRSLSILGQVPVEEIWQKDTVKHVVAVCRVSLVLAQWADTQKPTAWAIYAANATAAAITTNVSYAKASAYAAVYVAYTAIADSADTAAANAANAAYASCDAYTCAVISASSAYAAAADDYRLLNQVPVFTSEWWQPLWAAGEPVNVAKWWQAFGDNLRKLGLGFLADDLNDLWENRPLGDHVVNYLKNFSEAELNDPVALRRLILKGEVAEHIHAVRVLLLGPGGAGKSSLADRLQGKALEQSKRLTVGVDYLNHQPLNLYKTFPYLKQGDKPLSLYLWDFGGQTIFHGLHSAFLHENCVYVLVVDSRHEQAPDEWLHQIKHLAGGKAKVLLVTNWYETCETRQNEAQLLREFPDLLGRDRFFYFSCHDPDAFGLQEFVQALEQVCLDSQRMVLKETLDVNQALQERYQDDVFLEATDLDEIIIKVTGSAKAVETLPSKLEQLGFLVRVDGDDQNYCLKPAWAVDNAYRILYSPTLREASGILKLRTLQSQFKNVIKPAYIAHLIEFLQMRSLCCKLQTGDGYFFPDAALADEPLAVSKLLLDKTGLTIRFDLPYLPLGFHAGLINRLFGANGISDAKDIWRQGFILQRDESRAVVHYLSRKSVVEIVLEGEWKDFSELLSTLLVKMQEILDKGISEEQIVPSVVLSKQVVSVCSARQLVGVLSRIQSYNDLIEKVREMANRNINVNVGANAQVAIDAHNVTQKSNSENNTVEFKSDQRQQLAVIVRELLKNAGSLDPDALPAVAIVNKALAAPEDKPESRNLLGKVWHGVKEAADFTKTGTEIAGFVLEHQTAIAGAIATAVAAFS
jgi:GTPase SAR1 family protein